MLVESLFGLSQEGVDFVTGLDVTRCLGQLSGQLEGGSDRGRLALEDAASLVEQLRKLADEIDNLASLSASES